VIPQHNTIVLCFSVCFFIVIIIFLLLSSLDSAQVDIPIVIKKEGPTSVWPVWVIKCDHSEPNKAFHEINNTFAKVLNQFLPGFYYSIYQEDSFGG
jgi:hypothetical protein